MVGQYSILNHQAVCLPGLARSIGSDLRISYSGCSIHGRMQILCCWSHNNNDGTSLASLDELAACIIEQSREKLPATSWKSESTEHQQLLVVDCVKSWWQLVADSPKSGIGSHYGAKEEATGSLPHAENQRQLSINNFWSRIFGYPSSTWFQTSIKEELTAAVGRWARDIPTTASWTVTTYFIYNAATHSSWAFEPMNIVKMLYCDNHSCIACWLPMMKGQKPLMLRWRSFSWWSRERVPSSFAYEGGQYCIYDCLQPIATPITQHARPNLIDALLTLIFRMWQGACRSLLGP